MIIDWGQPVVQGTRQPDGSAKALGEQRYDKMKEDWLEKWAL